MTNPNFRPLLPSDEPFLWEMLYHALYVPPGQPPYPIEILQKPEIRRYVEGWGRDGDSGYLALVAAQPVGACWLRLFSQSAPGYGFINEETPELSIALLPNFRGQGIGSALMKYTLTHLDNKIHSVSLSVSATNPAVEMYRRSGFNPIKLDDLRINSSFVMVKTIK
ncbi:MAG TPA: GNAT family N-acetyltransferase [Anaerolineaceae bacterium]